MELKPGMRVLFRKDSPYYAEGVRAGTVIRTDLTLYQFLQHGAMGEQQQVASHELDWLLKATRGDFTAEELAEVRPIIRVDPCNAQPLGSFLASDPVHYEVIGDAPDVSLN